MFEGFTRTEIATSGTTINLVHDGEGPPLFLLHGYPQTHVMWHKVAPRLAEHYAVVVPDLPRLLRQREARLQRPERLL